MKEIKKTAITEYFRKSENEAPFHYNQSMMFRAAKRLNPHTLKATMQMLCCYHEILRSVWNGHQLLVRELNSPRLVLVKEYDLNRSSDVNADVLAIVEKLQSSIDLTNGPLVHVGHFHLPECDVVFMAIHHLVVDGVSWRIIAEDLNAIYPQLLSGTYQVRLPKIRCTFAEYADAVHQYAVSTELLAELPYWSHVAEQVNKDNIDFPSDWNEGGELSFSVEKDVSRRVVTECKIKYGVQVNDLMITAIARAWKKVTGRHSLALAMEGHGREPMGKHTKDLDRIVGWFTTIFPVSVDCSVENISDHVKKVAGIMAEIPNKGFGYGTLRHIANKDELICRPQMTFNYLGSFDEGGNTDQLFSIDYNLPQGNTVSPLNSKDNVPIGINCSMAEGCLTGQLDYAKNILSDSSARALMDEFAVQLSLL